MFRSPVSICVSMNPLAKATDESPVARGLSTRALLSETPFPLRFGTLIFYGIVVKYFVRRSANAFP
ncbi:hypothetical protein EYY85_12585 [Hafnia paralvei]|nr:hypothetical protein EYY85_12585 [Hafnia paralvei]